MTIQHGILYRAYSNMGNGNGTMYVLAEVWTKAVIFTAQRRTPSTVPDQCPIGAVIFDFNGGGAVIGSRL
jgi:hypothetical protein